MHHYDAIIRCTLQKQAIINFITARWLTDFFLRNNVTIFTRYSALYFRVSLTNCQNNHAILNFITLKPDSPI